MVVLEHDADVDVAVDGVAGEVEGIVQVWRNKGNQLVSIFHSTIHSAISILQFSSHCLL